MVLYFCKASSKCLFCRKRCENKRAKNLQSEDDESSHEKDKDAPPPETNDSEVLEGEPLCQEKSRPDGKDKGRNCSCSSFPVRFLGSSLDMWEDEEAFSENLKYAFVLRELLGYPKRKIIKYMKQQHHQLQEAKSTDNQDTCELPLDGWFSVCENCTKLVEEGHRVYHDIEELKIKLDDLRRNLKELLLTAAPPEEKQRDEKGDEENANENEEEQGEEDTIFAEVQDYFVPRSTTPKHNEKAQVVKMEIETSSPFDDDDPLLDEFLANENFDDGSDWAPSDPEELDGDDNESAEHLDVKPNIEDILSGSQDEGTELNAESREESNVEDTNEDKDSGHQLQKISSRIVTERDAEKRKIKMMRSTRSSKRLRREIVSDDPSELDDDEVQAVKDDEAEAESDGDAKLSKKQRADQKSKSVLSDSESESMTDYSDNSADDSDFDNDKEEKDRGKYACGICSATYTTKNGLKEHELLHSSEDAFKCELCPFVSASNRGLNMHTTKIHRKRKESKSVEKKVKSEKPTSAKTKPSPKPGKVGEHACRFCPVTFQTGHRLKEHEEHHLNLTDEMIRCQHCNYICLLERGMKIHVTRYHTNEGRSNFRERRNLSDDDEDEDGRNSGKEAEVQSASYPCKACSAVYKTQHRLREHKHLHLSDSAIRCSECPFVCKTSKSLQMHMHIDHGIKPRKPDNRRRPKKGRPKIYTTDPQHCDLCPAKYYTNHRFQQHVKLHSSKTNFPCEECGWVFSTSDKRDYHMKLSHNRSDITFKPAPKSYQCNHCDIPPFDLRYKYKEHLLLNHKDRIFQCSTCDQVYESQQLYELHIGKCSKKELQYEDHDEEADNDGDSSKKNKSFSCAQCNAKFFKQDMLNRHFALKHATEQFPCTLCTRVFPTESRLRYHMARQHDKIQNLCKICGYKAHGASHLRLHMQKHTKERLFACELCGKTFVSPTYLTAHRQKDHFQELGLDPIKCDQCDLLFPNNSILKYHIQKVHEKKFKYFCESCGKGFLFASGLKNHSAIHSTERNEICQICGAAYVHNRVLMDHMKKHHPEVYAAAKGIDASSVKVPPGINTQGPFICKFCNMEFPSRWGLHNHLKSHTEVYDKYKCRICGKGYSSPAGVKRHEETSHVAATFTCPNCGKQFPCKDYLRYHIKNHCHKKDSDSAVKVEPTPSTSKQRRNQGSDLKHDPHIVKEAGLLHIVTPSSAAALSSFSHGTHHPQATYNQQVQPGSGTSSSSSYASAPQLQQNPHHHQLQHQQHDHASDQEAAVNSLYRSYFSQQGFSHK